jgi:hypothetical protein
MPYPILGKGLAGYRGLQKNLFDLRRSAVVDNLHVIARAPASLKAA